MITTIALIVLAILIPPVIYDLVRRPTIRRLGLRNVTRRPGEAALVVGGSMLASALIAASFIVGTSFDDSIRNIAPNRWGPTDEVVVVDDPTRLDDVTASLAAVSSPDIDGVLAAINAEVAVASVGDGRRVEPTAELLEVDLANVQDFGGDAAATGFAGISAPSDGEVVLNQRLADELEIGVGDAVDVFVGATAARFSVGDVVPASGLAGFADIVVAPGAFSGVVSSAGADLADVASSVVLVSNTGDVFEGADRTAAVRTLIEGEASDLGAAIDVIPVKQSLLEDAEAEGAEMTQLFGTIGGFSVVAGILLVINLFVMLAGERTVELGTMRAVGLKRSHVLRSFALEGAIYGTLAALAGAILGIGVAAAVMAFAAMLFDANSGLEVGLAVRPADLVSGGVIGLAISQLTVVLTSLRTTRINIVRALRDLPPQAKPGSGRRRVASGVAGLALGGALTALGGSEATAVMLGPVIIAISLIPLLAFVMPRRTATAIGCGVGLVWPVAVFQVLPDVMDNPAIEVFLLQGILLVGLATAIFATLDSMWLSVVRRLPGGGIASKLGLAHPLARPVRTALLVAMYALVIFTVTFMAVLNTVFQASAPELAAHAGGGYELVVDSNRSAPIEDEDLLARAEVVDVSAVRRGFVDVTSKSAVELDGWPVSAIDASWSSELAPLAPSYSAAFATQTEAWESVANAVVGADGLPWIMAPDYSEWDVDERVELLAADGSAVPVRVAGLTRNNWLVDAGIYVPDEMAGALFGDQRPVSRYYVDLVDEADVYVVADAITASAPERGVDAEPFLGRAAVELDEQEGFLQMLQGYLALGLLIGIAGLGVVLVRAVRERRRELGMLKAVGVPTGQTQRAFLVEAGFIGAQGVVLGIGLGLLSSWQVLTRTTAFEEDLQFAVPVVALIALAVIAVTASLGAAIGPARSAARIPPAVALRTTG